MKTIKKAFLVIVLFALLIISSSSIVVTYENEYSLIRQFGKVDHVVSEAGISFKIPFIQSVDKLPNQTLLYDLPASDVITGDKKTMICDSYILWHITDPLKFSQTLNSSVSTAENRLDTIVYNSTDMEVTVMLSEAEKEAEILVAEGEAEYMRILADAYNDPSKTEFYSFVRSLDAVKASIVGDNKTVILSEDSPIAQIFNGQ